ncbi:hypothetical protein TNCV_247581 [Trichonephila clavipes]|nr:hypothetical protein TNCV_247581 [Trichonephila clavipes]
MLARLFLLAVTAKYIPVLIRRCNSGATCAVTPHTLPSSWNRFQSLEVTLKAIPSSSKGYFQLEHGTTPTECEGDIGDVSSGLDIEGLKLWCSVETYISGPLQPNLAALQKAEVIIRLLPQLQVRLQRKGIESFDWVENIPNRDEKEINNSA